MQKAIQEFLHYLEQVQGCAQNTILAYENDLMQFQRFINEGSNHAVGPDSYSQDRAEIYRARLSQEGYRPSTFYRKLAAVRSYLDYLREKGMLGVVAMSEQLRPSPMERKMPLVLSRDAIGKLLKAPANLDSPMALRDRAILELIYRTGLRASDIANLKLENVNFDLASLHAAGRICALEEAIEPIREYIDSGRPHLALNHEERALFLNQRGKGLTRQGIWLIVKRWSEVAELGEGVSPHTIRHSLVTHLLEDGRTVREVQIKLGMKSPNSIRIFTAAHRKAGSD